MCRALIATSALVVLSACPSQSSVTFDAAPINGTATAAAWPPIRKPTPFVSTTVAGQARVEEAAKKEPIVRAMFASAGVSYPPSQLLLRVFKQENLLEEWAASIDHGPLTLVTTYEICASSGDLGPKRRQGDKQVPEGFYNVDFFHPKSAFFLALRINYPNDADRVLGDKQHLGSAIMIHGNCVSIGCLAMSDQRIAEIWVAATAVHDRDRPVNVHIFPTRKMDELQKKQGDEHRVFWRNIKQGFDLFERNHRLPKVSVARDGAYRFKQ